jgi:hypothetical protein
MNRPTRRESMRTDRWIVVDARKAEYEKWVKSCERQERIVDQARARHWLAYGQKWSDEETAARKRKAFADSGCQPLP